MCSNIKEEKQDIEGINCHTIHNSGKELLSETYTLTTTEEEGVGDHLPTPVMAATAMETDSENVVYTEVNYENEACWLPLNGYSQEAIMD